MVVQSTSFSTTTEIAEVRDAAGDYVAASIGGVRTSGTVEAVNNGFTGAIASTLTVTGFPAGTYFITEKSGGRTNDGFETVTTGVRSWGGIS
jgi:hypothetical protein